MRVSHWNLCRPSVYRLAPVTATLIAVAVMVAATTLAAQPIVTAGEMAGVERITAENLAELITGGEVVVLDVRDRSAYEAAHIPGARHVPNHRLVAELEDLPQDKPIVTYCT